MKTTPRCRGELMAEAAAEGFDTPEAHANALRTRRELARAQAALDRMDDAPEPDDSDPGPYTLNDIRR